MVARAFITMGLDAEDEEIFLARVVLMAQM